MPLCSSRAAAQDGPGHAEFEQKRHAGLGDGLVVRLVTFGPGSDIFSYFGHNALWIEDTRQRRSLLFNFGMFSFASDTALEYMGGRLEFWGAATPLAATFAAYRREARAIRAIELNLPPEARWKLLRQLEHAVQPENRIYLYDHYRENCSTRVRDLIDNATGGQLKAHWSGPAERTYRDHTRRYCAVSKPFEFLLVYWMNNSLDQPIRQYDEAFLPEVLEAQVRQTTLRDAEGREVPLAGERMTLFDAQARPKAPYRSAPLWPWTLALGGALGLALARLIRRAESGGSGNEAPRRLRALGAVYAGLGLVFGLPAFCLLVMALATDHRFAYWNINLLWIGPWVLAYLPLGVAILLQSKRAKRWSDWLNLLSAGALVFAGGLQLLPFFRQENVSVIALAVPWQATAAWASWMTWRALP